MDFIQCMLQMDPRMRMTAEQALGHPWIVNRVRTGVLANNDEVRQDNESVEVVFKGLARRESIVCDAEKENLRIPVLV